MSDSKLTKTGQNYSVCLCIYTIYMYVQLAIHTKYERKNCVHTHTHSRIVRSSQSIVLGVVVNVVVCTLRLSFFNEIGTSIGATISASRSRGCTVHSVTLTVDCNLMCALNAFAMVHYSFFNVAHIFSLTLCEMTLKIWNVPKVFHFRALPCWTCIDFMSNSSALKIYQENWELFGPIALKAGTQEIAKYRRICTFSHFYDALSIWMFSFYVCGE